MLVISRERGTSIHVGSVGETVLVTVLDVMHARRAIEVLVSRTAAERPGHLDSRTLELVVDAGLTLGSGTRLTLVDVREGKARLGIDAAEGTRVHRLEVYEAIRRENRDGGSDPEGGTAGAPVPDTGAAVAGRSA